MTARVIKRKEIAPLTETLGEFFKELALKGEENSDYRTKKYKASKKLSDK